MRPCIICHMMASLDGRIDCAMTEKIGSSDPYYQTLAELGCPSMMEGRVTLAMHYALPGKYEPRAGAEATGRKVFRAVQAPGYAVGVDTRGELLWGDNTKEQFGKPLLMLLSEDVGEDYLEYLSGKGFPTSRSARGELTLRPQWRFFTTHSASAGLRSLAEDTSTARCSISGSLTR